MNKLWRRLRALYGRYREPVDYVLGGGVTTLVNWAAYVLCLDGLGIPNVPSDIIALVLSVAAAFVINKLLVFRSRGGGVKRLLREAWEFLLVRGVSSVADVGLMYLTVDVLALPARWMKLAVTMLVILMNYAGSKRWVFRK